MRSIPISKTNKVLDGLRFVCACCWTEGQPEYTIGTDTGSLFHNIRNHLTSGGHIKRMQKYLKTTIGDKQLLLTSLFVPINESKIRTLSIFKTPKDKALAKQCYGYRPHPKSKAE